MTYVRCHNAETRYVIVSDRSSRYEKYIRDRWSYSGPSVAVPRSFFPFP